MSDAMSGIQDFLPLASVTVCPSLVAVKKLR